MVNKRLDDILEASECLTEGISLEELKKIEEVTETSEKILGFTVLVFKEAGGMTIGITADIPPGIAGFETPSMKLMLGYRLLEKVFLETIKKKEIIREAEQQRILDSARGKKRDWVRLTYLLTQDGLELLPGEDLEVLANASHKA